MDAELQAIREARLAQLKAGSGGSGGSAGSNSGSGSSSNGALAGLLEPAALERLSRVALVRPDRAQAVERYVQQLASSGQLRRKVGEAEVVRILDGVAREQGKREDTRIVFERKGEATATSTTTAQDAQDSEDDFFDE